MHRIQSPQWHEIKPTSYIPSLQQHFLFLICISMCLVYRKRGLIVLKREAVANITKILSGSLQNLSIPRLHLSSTTITGVKLLLKATSMS